MFNNITKKLLLSLSLGLFVGIGIFISYAVERTSLLEDINDGDILTTSWFNNVKNRLVNINDSGIYSGSINANQINAGGTALISITGNAATASSVPWTGVTGRPTTVSSFTNDAGYITSLADNRVNTTGDNITGNLNVSGKVGIGTTNPAAKLDVNGNIKFSGGIIDSAGIRMDDAGGWIRTYGNTGWYNGTYGGGWYMTDTTRLRTYNGKSIATNGNLQVDGIIYALGSIRFSDGTVQTTAAKTTPVNVISSNCITPTATGREQARVSCSTGYKVTGGGVWRNSGSNEIIGTGPWGNGWTGRAEGDNVIVRAMCCQIVTVYK